MKSKDKLEVELRARVDESILQKISVPLESQSDEYDSYFRYDPDTNKDWVVRIRRRQERFFLTFKSNKKFGEGAWSEINLEIDKETSKKFRDFFISNGFILDVEIVKNRKTFYHEDLEINIDDIKGLGMFIEAEIMTNDIEMGKEKIKKFFQSLGISDDQIINKGYVALIKEL